MNTRFFRANKIFIWCLRKQITPLFNLRKIASLLTRWKQNSINIFTISLFTFYFVGFNFLKIDLRLFHL